MEQVAASITPATKVTGAEVESPVVGSVTLAVTVMSSGEVAVSP
jgi:hypothetical protein